MKRQWKQMKKKSLPNDFDLDKCFHCQKKTPALGWFFCRDCLQLPEIQRKIRGIVIRGDI